MHATAAEIRRAQLDFESVASGHMADIDPKPSPDVVDVTARSRIGRDRSGGDEFYDFELDVTGNHGQPPPGFR